MSPATSRGRFGQRVPHSVIRSRPDKHGSGMIGMVRRTLLYVALGALAVALFIAWQKTCAITIPVVNSDSLYPYLFATDTFPEQNQGWLISPAPSYPDLVVVVILGRFVHTLAGIYTAYSAVVLVALLAITYGVQRALGSGRPLALGAALLGLVAVYGGRREASELRVPLVCPTYHGIVLLLALASFGWLVLGTKRGATRQASGPPLLIGALACGDTLFVTTVLAAVGVVLALPLVTPPLQHGASANLKRFLLRASLGFLAGRALFGWLGPAVPQPGYLISVARAIAGFQGLLEFPLRTELAPPARALLAVWALAIGGGIVFWLVKRPRRLGFEPIMLFLGLLMPVFAVCFPILIGEQTDHISVRYMLVAFHFPAILFTLPRIVVPERLRTAAFVVFAAFDVAIVFAAAGPDILPFPGLFGPEMPDHALGEKVRSLVASGTKTGFAGYWDAKSLMYSVGDGLHTMSIFENELYWWLDNGDWLFAYDPATAHWGYPAKYFVVDRDLDQKFLADHFGTPAQKETFAKVTLLEYDFDATCYGKLVHFMCSHMATFGKRCALERGLVDVDPLLHEGAYAVSVPRGRYRAEGANAWIAHQGGPHATSIVVTALEEITIGAAPGSPAGLRLVPER